MNARGTFAVKLTPEAGGPDLPIRMSIDKTFEGDLEAASKGGMLAVRNAVEGSAGYVAMERVTGELAGRTGTLVLQHSGTMTRGVAEQSVTVVPEGVGGDCGADDDFTKPAGPVCKLWRIQPSCLIPRLNARGKISSISRGCASINAIAASSLSRGPIAGKSASISSADCPCLSAQATLSSETLVSVM